MSWRLVEFYYNSGLQRLFTGTFAILREMITVFLCPLICFFLKVKHINYILKDGIKFNRNLWWLVEIKLLLDDIDDSFHETSLFFVLPKLVEIILMRSLHDPVVSKLCQNSWNGL